MRRLRLWIARVLVRTANRIEDTVQGVILACRDHPTYAQPLGAAVAPVLAKVGLHLSDPICTLLGVAALAWAAKRTHDRVTPNHRVPAPRKRTAPRSVP